MQRKILGLFVPLVAFAAMLAAPVMSQAAVLEAGGKPIAQWTPVVEGQGTFHFSEGAYEYGCALTGVKGYVLRNDEEEAELGLYGMTFGPSNSYCVIFETLGWRIGAHNPEGISGWRVNINSSGEATLSGLNFATWEDEDFIFDFGVYYWKSGSLAYESTYGAPSVAAGFAYEDLTFEEVLPRLEGWTGGKEVTFSSTFTMETEDGVIRLQGP